MDFKERIEQLHITVSKIRDRVIESGIDFNEEMTKNSCILPFIDALGYNTKDPFEVIPEFTADTPDKKGEKVDIAIKKDDEVIFIIECKPMGAQLEKKHLGQLFRYYNVSKSKFGLLTDGLRYLFYASLDNGKSMDETAFFEFNILKYKESQLLELKKFTKSNFDRETILDTASNLKYHKLLKEKVAEIFNEDNIPAEFVKMLARNVYGDGKRITSQVLDLFQVLTKNALKEFLRDKVNERLDSAKIEETQEASGGQAIEEVGSKDKRVGIETTEDEIEGHRIIQTIASEIVEPETITMRDAKSYCAIFFQDNNRKPISRFYFSANKLTIGIFAEPEEERFELEKLTDIFKYRNQILQAVQRYQS